MKKIFNFIKNNGLLILAIFWLVDFVFCLITSNPADDTSRLIRSLNLDVDLLWSLVFFGMYATSKIENLLNERINYVNKRIDLLFDFIEEAAKLMESKEAEEAADKEEKKEEADDKKVS